MNWDTAAKIATYGGLYAAAVLLAIQALARALPGVRRRLVPRFMRRRFWSVVPVVLLTAVFAVWASRDIGPPHWSTRTVPPPATGPASRPAGNTPSAAAANKTHLALQLYGVSNAPVETEAINLHWSWWTVTESASIINPAFEQSALLLFVAFDKPEHYDDFRLTVSGDFPLLWEKYQVTDRTALLLLHNPPIGRLLTIEPVKAGE